MKRKKTHIKTNRKISLILKIIIIIIMIIIKKRILFAMSVFREKKNPWLLVVIFPKVHKKGFSVHHIQHLKIMDRPSDTNILYLYLDLSVFEMSVNRYPQFNKKQSPQKKVFSLFE
jgi:hypothetical protein